jgi:hypothetical protein
MNPIAQTDEKYGEHGNYLKLKNVQGEISLLPPAKNEKGDSIIRCRFCLLYLGYIDMKFANKEQ